MGAEKMTSLLLFFFVLLILIIGIACCTACIKPAGSISKSLNKRRGRRFTRRRSNEVHTEEDGLIAEEIATASPMVVPPYPVEPQHPLPQSAQVPLPPGFVVSNPPYPTQTPHPVPAQFIYPVPVGAPQTVPYSSGSTPYPPTNPTGVTSAPYPDYATQPPSYYEAVAQPPVQPPLPSKEGYSKQSPYNPNY